MRCLGVACDGRILEDLFPMMQQACSRAFLRHSGMAARRRWAGISEFCVY